MKTITIEIVSENAEQVIQSLINANEVVLTGNSVNMAAENLAGYGSVAKEKIEELSSKDISQSPPKRGLTGNDFLDMFPPILTNDEAEKMLEYVRKSREECW